MSVIKKNGAQSKLIAFKIAQRNITLQSKPYIVAEMSCNHIGKIGIAKDLIRAAAGAGADAVKLQTFKPNTMTIDCDRPDFIIKGGLWNGYKLFDLYKQAYTPWEWTGELFQLANDLGIDIFSSPFDETAVDFLEQYAPPAYKIASLELTDSYLLKKVAKTGRPIILSTGLATEEEVRTAINVLQQNGTTQICLLHCISGYPTALEDANISAVTHLQSEFDVIVGLSDHSKSPIVAAGAVALGARVIEKHLVLNRNDGSLDSEFSLEPSEFEQLVKSCNDMYQAIGTPNHDPIRSEENTRLHRRSLYVVEDAKAGDKLSPANLRRIRPGYGISCEHYEKVLGRKLRNDKKRGTPLMFDDLI